jgi:hypothetical protein
MPWPPVPAPADIGQQHGVIEGRDGDVVIGHHGHVVFQVLADLEDALVLQNGFQERQRTLFSPSAGSSWPEPSRSSPEVWVSGT